MTRLVAYWDRDRAFADLGTPEREIKVKPEPQTAHDIYGDSWIDRS